MRDINGKIAWVTGAGTGIGEAAAKALAAEGCIVILTGRRKEPLEKVQGIITQAGGKAEVQSGDLGKAASVKRIVDAIIAAHGRLERDLFKRSAAERVGGRRLAARLARHSASRSSIGGASLSQAWRSTAASATTSAW